MSNTPKRIKRHFPENVFSRGGKWSVLGQKDAKIEKVSSVKNRVFRVFRVISGFETDQNRDRNDTNRDKT